MKPHLLVTTWFFSGQPGFLDFSYRLRALSSRYRLTIVFREAESRAELEGIDAEKLVIPSNPNTLGLLTYTWKLFDLTRRLNPDLVVVLGSQMVLLSLLVRTTPLLVYWNEHPSHFFDYSRGRGPKRWFARMLYRLSYKAAKSSDILMPIGEAHADDLRENDVPQESIRLIPMGVSDTFAVAARERALSRKTRTTVIYAGTVAEDRGRDVMLEGLALAVRGGCDVTLTLVGADAEQIAYCQTRAGDLDITDHLSIMGRVPGHEIPRLLSQHDAGICIWADRPWWRFNPPTKLFEYLVAGLPVLASRIRTHTSYIQDGENGLIFDYDAASFAKALERLASDPGIRMTMSRTAVVDGQKYLWSAIEPEFLALVDAMVSARSRD